MPRPRPYLLLVLLLACDPNAGTEVGNPTYGCGGEAGADSDVGHGDPSCAPGGGFVVRCDGARCAVVDFGEVPVGKTATVMLALENADCATVILSPPAIDGEVRVLGGPADPVTLDSGARVYFLLGFTPERAGSTGGQLRFALDSGEVFRLPWVGEGS